MEGGCSCVPRPVQYSAVQHDTMRYGTVQHWAAENQCSIVRYDTVQCGTGRYSIGRDHSTTQHSGVRYTVRYTVRYDTAE